MVRPALTTISKFTNTILKSHKNSVSSTADCGKHRLWEGDTSVILSGNVSSSEFTFTFIVTIIISVFVPGRSVPSIPSFLPHVTVLVQKHIIICKFRRRHEFSTIGCTVFIRKFQNIWIFLRSEGARSTRANYRIVCSNTGPSLSIWRVLSSIANALDFGNPGGGGGKSS
jgi:hypothetical protein